MPDPMPVLRPSDATNLAGQETGRDHLSHSSITTQINCLRRFELQHEQGLRTISEPRPLGLGKAFQKAIELGDPDVGVEALTEALPEFMDKEAIDRARVEEAIVQGAALAYLNRWGTSENGTREFEYRVRLRSPWTGRPSQTFDLLGYADEVIDNGTYLELVENKLVGRVDPVDVKRLPLDRQVGLACYGLWRATGLAVQRVHYRFTKKPSIRQKQNETVSQFCTRLLEDYANPERQDFYTHEERLFRSQDDLLRIEAELWDWAEQRRNARQRSFYSRNTSHCRDYGGCPYIPICTGDPDAAALYTRREDREALKEAV